MSYDPSLDDEISLQIQRMADAEIESREINQPEKNGADITVRGMAVPGREAANLEKYGAPSPYHRYCFMMPAISAEDLAKDWGVSQKRVYSWISLGGWVNIRRKWLETVPIHNGGSLSGDLEEERNQYIREQLGNWRETVQITMDRMRQRKEQEASFDASKKIDIKKSSESHLKDVMALKIADDQTRLAFGLPTKMTASISQSTHRREEVKESVVHVPAHQSENYDVDAAIDPPALPPIGGQTFEGEVVSSTTHTLSATSGDDEEELP
ncbi:MAG: hypothetical protein KY445_17440 [Armatimonadetes bacterium]|nr:hypothetical protein [Armatimonadota bacterium]